MSKYKFNDYFNISYFGCLQSSEDVALSMRKTTIFGNDVYGGFGVDLNLKI